MNDFKSSPSRSAASGQLRLALADYNAENGNVTVAEDGCLFECTLGPVSAPVLAALDRAAAAHEQICLDSARPILLELRSVERKDPERVRIVGNLLDPTSASSWTRESPR